MKVEFTIADESHIEEIINLCNECFDEETNIEEAKKIFNENKEDKNTIYLVGYIGHILVAHTRIAIVPTIFKGMDTYAILNHVCVSPEYRKHKIATKMLNEIEHLCKERGCTYLKLWSGNQREAAHACYKKLGFIPINATFFEKKLNLNRE